MCRSGFAQSWQIYFGSVIYRLVRGCLIVVTYVKDRMSVSVVSYPFLPPPSSSSFSLDAWTLPWILTRTVIFPNARPLHSLQRTQPSLSSFGALIRFIPTHAAWSRRVQRVELYIRLPDTVTDDDLLIKVISG